MDPRLSAPVLEREDVLGTLAGWYDAVPEQGGVLVLLAGEAGIGKTTVARELVRRSEAPAWWGQCDPLTTPRPLGPLLDIAADRCTGLDLAGSEQSTGRLALETFLRALQRADVPPVVVLEDLHWADDATLDLLRFVGRRVTGTRALVLGTYRDDEVGPDHRLGPIVGDLLRVDGVRRITLPPLTHRAVTVLAGPSGLDADRLHRMTAGNPFFVTEVVASGDFSSTTVRDAVMARVGRLDQDARTVIEAVATEPRALELEYVTPATGVESDAVDRAVGSGVLVGESGRLRFRHELARTAVAASTGLARRAHLHSTLLQLLTAADRPDLSRLAHHAVGSGVPALVVQYAPAAARQAVARGAAKEAAQLFEAALSHAELLDERCEVELRIEYGSVLTNVDRQQGGLAEGQRASALARRVGDAELLGRALMLQSRGLWLTGRTAASRAVQDQAIEVLRRTGPSRHLAEALWVAARLQMLARRHEPAVTRARQAAAMAERIGAPEEALHARLMIGTAELVTGDAERGIELLTRVADEAADTGQAVVASAAYSMLGTGGGEVRRYDAAFDWLDRVIALDGAADRDYGVAYALSWQARIRFEQGRWDDATRLAERPAALAAEAAVITPVTALATLGRIRVRQGDPDPAAPLHRALELGAAAELQHRWPAHCGAAELGWLQGRPEQAAARLRPVYAEALETDSTWARGEVGYWLWRTGGLDTEPDGWAEPFAGMVSGDWERAAGLWRELGCPYEEGLALAEGDVDAMLRGLAIFDRLGAGPASAWLRGRLRDAGVTRLPRGPRPSTLAHPEGLTDRQAEVHRLLLEGLSNADIAAALFISPKTVEHHVSAVLAKLAVTSREELRRRPGPPPV